MNVLEAALANGAGGALTVVLVLAGRRLYHLAASRKRAVILEREGGLWSIRATRDDVRELDVGILRDGVVSWRRIGGGAGGNAPVPANTRFALNEDLPDEGEVHLMWVEGVGRRARVSEEGRRPVCRAAGDERLTADALAQTLLDHPCAASRGTSREIIRRHSPAWHEAAPREGRPVPFRCERDEPGA